MYNAKRSYIELYLITFQNTKAYNFTLMTNSCAYKVRSKYTVNVTDPFGHF